MTEEVVSSLVLVAMTAGKHEEEEDAMRKKRIANNMVEWLAGWLALDQGGNVVV